MAPRRRTVCGCNPSSLSRPHGGLGLSTAFLDVELVVDPVAATKLVQAVHARPDEFGADAAHGCLSFWATHVNRSQDTVSRQSIVQDSQPHSDATNRRHGCISATSPESGGPSAS
jgi:hypothetical protein